MDVELRPMTGGEYEAFLQRNLSRYAQELLLTKKTDVEQHALAEAQGALEEILSKGQDTPLNYLLTAEDETGTPVGEVWCDTTEPETVFVNDFYVYPEHRRQGCADAMLRAVEQIAVTRRIRPRDDACLPRKQGLRRVFHQAGLSPRRRRDRGHTVSGKEAVKKRFPF